MPQLPLMLEHGWLAENANQFRSGAGRSAASVKVEAVDGIAVLNIDGPIYRRPSALDVMFGTVSSEDIADQLAELTQSDAVEGIVLRVNSPGGEAQGTFELSQAVKQAAAVKPVVAFADGLMASAAYFMSAHATAITARSQDTRVGSIGTRLLMYDVSESFKQDGIKPVLIDTGEFKSTGAMGVEITESQQAYLRDWVNQLQTPFASAVAEGRARSGVQMAEVTTGKVYFAADAQSKGLVDAVESFESTLARVEALVKEKKMSKPATYADLKACLPGASAEFLCEAMEKGMTLDQAQSSWMEKQTAVQTAKDAEIADLKAKLALAEANPPKPAVVPVAIPGVDPNAVVDPPKPTITDVRAEFKNRVQAEVDRGKTRADAVIAVNRQFPELRKQLVALAN